MKLSVGPRGSWAVSTLVWGQPKPALPPVEEDIPPTLRSPHLWWVAEAVDAATSEDDEDPITSSEVIALFV